MVNNVCLFLIFFMQQDKISEFIEGLLAKMKMDAQDVKKDQITEKEWYFNITSGDEFSLLGRNGDVLHGLSQVVKTVSRAQGWLTEGDVLRLDVGNYRKKQEENVVRMTEQKCDMVMSSGQSATLPPMSPYFRRLVHLEVSEKFPKLMTSSEGAGNYRAVRISRRNGSLE